MERDEENTPITFLCKLDELSMRYRGRRVVEGAVSGGRKIFSV